MLLAAVVLIEEGPVYWHAVLSGYRSEHDDQYFQLYTKVPRWFSGTVYPICIRDGSAALCVGPKNLNVFHCFDQLSLSKLQQMEVELKIRESVNFTA